MSDLARTSTRFRLAVAGLEVALGHDGFLRGAPDPVLMIAVWVRDQGRVKLIGRELYRFDVAPPFPGKFPAPRQVPIQAGIRHPGPLDFLILAAALEQDGGQDIGRIYGALEREDRLALWPPSGDGVEPLHVVEINWSRPTIVELLVDEQRPAKTCSDDKWISAVAWGIVSSPTPGERLYRLPFLADDKRNDWTAFVTVQC